MLVGHEEEQFETSSTSRTGRTDGVVGVRRSDGLNGAGGLATEALTSRGYNDGFDCIYGCTSRLEG